MTSFPKENYIIKEPIWALLDRLTCLPAAGCTCEILNLLRIHILSLSLLSLLNFLLYFTAILAVGNEGHAINIYDLGDLTCDKFEEVIACERPVKILFSIAPVDALGFIKQNFIALASISNRTITLWRVLAAT